MTKIAVMQPAGIGAVEYYRSVGVLQYLHKIDNSIEIVFVDQCQWQTLIGYDIFYIQRPQYEGDLKNIKCN